MFCTCLDEQNSITKQKFDDKMKTKTKLFCRPSNDFLAILVSGRLLKTENKIMCHISGLKSGRSRLKKLSSGHLQQSFWLKQNGYLQSRHLQEVAAYKKCSLGENWLCVCRMYYSNSRW